MARNRFKRDDEEEFENPGEVLTAIPVAELAKEAPEQPEAEGDVVTTPTAPEAPVPSETAEQPAEKPAVNDILADLIPKKPKPKPDTYGFYLDSDVHDELVKLAKANKTNKSKYLNALLRRVLFGE